MSYDLKNEDDVKEFLEKLGIEYRFGCFSEKNPESCQLLGDYFEGVKKDYAKAANLYRTNCDDNSFARSCFKYGQFSFLGKGTKKNLEQAFKYYEKGCDAGDPDSCLNSGLMCISKSKEVVRLPKNLQKGVSLLSKACDKNHAFACHYIAGIYIQGMKDVVAKDMNKAFELSLKSCELGNLYACANVSQMYRKGEGVAEDFAKSEEYKKKAIEIQDQMKIQQPIVFGEEK